MKNTKEKSKRHIVMGVSMLILALLVLITTATFVTLSVVNEPTSWRERAPDLPMQETTGKVTRINKNSQDYILNENGKKVPGPLYGVADVGDAIYVDGSLFQTSSGGSGDKRRFYIDIKSIELGETVTVNFGVTETGEKTLNCKRCAVSLESL